MSLVAVTVLLPVAFSPEETRGVETSKNKYDASAFPDVAPIGGAVDHLADF